MEGTYLRTMYEIHGRIEAGIVSGDIDGQDFAGLGLAGVGDSTFVTAKQVKKIKNNLPAVEALRLQLSEKEESSLGMVFSKEIFYNMLRRVGGFYVFRHLDEQGRTHSVHLQNRSRVTIHQWVVILTAVVCLSLVSWLVFTFVTYVEPSHGETPKETLQKIQALSIFFGTGILMLVLAFLNNEILGISPEKRLRTMGKLEALKFLWPVGFDYGRSRDKQQVSVRVLFPDRSPEVNAEIKRVLRLCKELGGSPVMVAHEKAIGLELGSVMLHKTEKKDPFLCFEVGPSIAVFDKTLFGDIDEEYEMIRKLHETFDQMQFGHSN